MQQPRRGGGEKKQLPSPKCPRCDSLSTKFCYYNNYTVTQPRYFCRTCRRYWTLGGIQRHVPVGGGCRKGRRGRPSTSGGSPRAHPPQGQQGSVPTLLQNSISAAIADLSLALSTPWTAELGRGLTSHPTPVMASYSPLNQPRRMIQPFNPTLNLGSDKSGGSSSMDLFSSYGNPSVSSVQQHQPTQFHQEGLAHASRAFAGSFESQQSWGQGFNNTTNFATPETAFCSPAPITTPSPTPAAAATNNGNNTSSGPAFDFDLWSQAPGYGHP